MDVSVRYEDVRSVNKRFLLFSKLVSKKVGSPKDCGTRLYREAGFTE